MLKNTPHARLQPKGAQKLMFLDQEIAHIASVMPASLAEGRGGPILSSRYWRTRLNKLLDAAHLTRSQLYALDRLLRQLDAFEAKHRRAEAANDPSALLNISTTCVPHPRTS
ncbi:hypothetical protein P3T24_006875 [Paraburkholderia sp. GAS33]|jgi:hypothetical protein|uniref:hypothetical protein n=1 Tax=Paraburkholderia sp. GAS33 TaxID=3035130 RepID=UPI003D1931F2